jgi:hypothetical protein
MLHRRTGPIMRLVVVMMAGLLLLAGCAPARPLPAVSDDGSAMTPVAGGRLVVGGIADAKVLNPVLSRAPWSRRG